MSSELSVEKRIEAYQKLSDSASSRATSRRGMEWRMALALWSAFGAAIGVVLTSSNWHPGWLDVSLALAASIAIVVMFGCVWLPYLSLAGQRELRQSLFWESHVQKHLGVSLPSHLMPTKRPFSPSEWAVASDQDSDGIGGQTTGERRKLKAGIHEAQWFQLVITILFAILLNVALFEKMATPQIVPIRGPHLEIEGSRIEIQGSSTIDVK